MHDKREDGGRLVVLEGGQDLGFGLGPARRLGGPPGVGPGQSIESRLLKNKTKKIEFPFFIVVIINF